MKDPPRQEGERRETANGLDMNQSESNIGSSDPHRAALRDRALMYGFVGSIIGLPVGVG